MTNPLGYIAWSELSSSGHRGWWFSESLHEHALSFPAPFVWSTTVAGFPAPIITTRSIQIGVSKWPLGSAELEEAKMDTQQENNYQSRKEDPRDGGAWWAAIYGVAQGWI